MPAGPGGKDVVVDLLAHDSFHGPAEAGHVVEVDFARAFEHALPIAPQPCKIKRCAETGYTLGASASLRRAEVELQHANVGSDYAMEVLAMVIIR